MLLGDLLQLLELHRELALLDLVVREHLELRREAEHVRREDEPLRGIVLIPLDGVAEVLGELVVLRGAGAVSFERFKPKQTLADSSTHKVVVTLSDGDERGEDVVAGSVLQWRIGVSD